MYKSKTVLPECVSQLLKGTLPDVKGSVLIQYLWETQQKLEKSLELKLEELSCFYDLVDSGVEYIPSKQDYEAANTASVVLENSKWVSTQLGGCFDHSKPTKEAVQELIEEGHKLCDSLEESIDKIAERGSE